MTLCGLVVFTDMNAYVLTKGRNFKIFLKKNYAIILDGRYVFTKKMLNMGLGMMLIVLMKFAHIMTFLNFLVDSINNLQFKQIVSL